MMGMGEKPRNTKTNTKQRKKIPRLVVPHPPFYEMEANCFQVFESTENKSDPP